MVSLIQALSAPGMRKPVTRAATTVTIQQKLQDATDHEVEDQAQDDAFTKNYNVIDEEKPRLLDRWLDTVVAASGSSPVLFLIVLLVLVWALMGIRFGQSENWQVLISDVQALLCYILDSLLMRQQLNAYDREIRIVAVMKSRSISVRRMLRQVQRSQRSSDHPEPRHVSTQSVELTPPDVNQTSRISKMVDVVCDFLGHFVTMILFWICIFIWLGFGPFCSWSVRWQLYINSATSALMILVFALLAYIREQHKVQTSAYLRHVCDLDVHLESQLRQLTHDDIPNESVTVNVSRVGHLERAISYYADLVGTLAGICLLMSVTVVWIVIGPALHFSSNWWLIIGTYAGLIGMHDGFVLHNVQSQLNRHSQVSLADVARDDLEARTIVSLQPVHGTADPESQVQPAPSSANPTLTTRISSHLSNTMSHPFAVLVGIFFIIGLLVAASALHWSTTGQLLCNIPPSIIETFVMMALITREKLDWADDRQVWCGIGEGRALLIGWVEWAKGDAGSEEKIEGKEKVEGEVEEVAEIRLDEDGNGMEEVA